MDLFYDREGKPIPTLEWARLYEDYDYRFIARDEIPESDCVLVTVWEGINHAVFPDERTTLFNTGLLRESGEHLTLLHEWSWKTDAEAAAGHTDLLAEITEIGLTDFLATQEQD